MAALRPAPVAPAVAPARSQRAQYARLVTEFRQQRRARERETYDGHDRVSHAVTMHDLAQRRRRRIWNRRMAARIVPRIVPRPGSRTGECGRLRHPLLRPQRHPHGKLPGLWHARLGRAPGRLAASRV